MIHGIGEVKKAVPQMAISASAPTYLRQYSDLYAAGAVEEGLCDQMLFNTALPTDFESSKSSFVLEPGDSDSAVMETSIGQGKTLVTRFTWR